MVERPFKGTADVVTAKVNVKTRAEFIKYIFADIECEKKLIVCFQTELWKSSARGKLRKLEKIKLLPEKTFWV